MRHHFNLTTLFVFAIMLCSHTVFAREPSPAGVVFEKNIEYSNPDEQHLQLNMARPRNGNGPFPVIVCIHGGGFRAGSREGFNGLCQQLAKHGYVAVTVSYRLAPKYPFPAAIHDVKAAVRWVRANAEKYNIDAGRVGTTGGSAGGHLAQYLGVTRGIKRFEGSGGNPSIPVTSTVSLISMAPAISPNRTMPVSMQQRSCHSFWVAIWNKKNKDTLWLALCTG